MDHDDGRPTQAGDGYHSAPTPQYGAPQGQPPFYEGHPLFPRADGSPEDADIRYVSFLRRVDGALKHCPEDIPTNEVQSWDQVWDWWGGGDYQAIAKTANHQVIRHAPGKAEWMSLDGPPRPLVKRGAVVAAAPVRAPETAAPAPALPAGMAEVLGVVTKLADRVDRMQDRMAAPATGGQDFMTVIMNMQTKAQEAAAGIQQEQIRQAGETSRMMMQMMMKGGKAEDSESKLVALLGMLKPYLKPDAAPLPPLAPDPFTILARAKDLGLLGASAAPSLAADLKPIAETVGNVITQQIHADGKAKVAEAEARKAELLAARADAPPQRRDRDRDPPPLTYVQGLGMVHVVVAESAPAHVAGARAAVGPAPSAPVAAPLAAAPPPPAAPPPSPVPAEPGPPAVALQSALPPQVAPPPQPAPADTAVAVQPAPADTAVAVQPAPAVEPPGPPASSKAFVQEFPPEVSSALGAAAAEVTLREKALLAGMLGRLKELPVASRAPVIQKFFPAFDDKELANLAKMVDDLPMIQLWGLVDTLPPAEVHRLTQFNDLIPRKA
jgi:hypothetical protein